MNSRQQQFRQLNLLKIHRYLHFFKLFISRQYVPIHWRPLLFPISMPMLSWLNREFMRNMQKIIFLQIEQKFMKYRSTADGKSLISQHQILQFIHLYNLIRISLNTISIEYKTDYLLIQITENTPSISTMIQTNNFSFRLLTNEVIPTKLLSKRVIKINNLAQIYFLPQEQQNSMCLLNSINQEQFVYEQQESKLIFNKLTIKLSQQFWSLLGQHFSLFGSAQLSQNIPRKNELSKSKSKQLQGIVMKINKIKR